MTNNNDQHHKEIFQLERIALFSDAVFAIAITLLIIEVKIPVLPYSSAEFSKEFPHAMNEMIPEFIGFLISFMVIGNYWRSHHSTFYFIKDYDNKLLRLNTFFLLTIVIMPFTTAFMSRYMFFQPFFIYCLNVIASGLLQIRMWRYVTGDKNTLHTPLPRGIKSYKTTTSIIAIGCFCIAIIIHKLPIFPGNLGGFIARMFLASIFIIDIFTHRYYRKKYNLGNKY
ncbi:MAG: TMEM175 family protein [Chitinophagaceae bacterium]